VLKGDHLRLWGVRGSVPTPGPRTALVGGNTACIEIQLAGERLLLDAGTGLRQLGLAQQGAPIAATLLFSHLHWDHIQGLPFCVPLYHPASEVRLVGPVGLKEALARQMSRPSFPVGLDVLGARITYEETAPGAQLAVGAVTVQTTLLDHPGGAIGYRLAGNGCAVVYACDVELRPGAEIDGQLRALAYQADVLIVDAQYLPDELPAKRGWGHSSYEQAAQLARAAEVRTLLLTHHDPQRDDAAVLALEQRARSLFAETWAAREGMIFNLAAAPDSRRGSCLPSALPALAS